MCFVISFFGGYSSWIQTKRACVRPKKEKTEKKRQDAPTYLQTETKNRKQKRKPHEYVPARWRPRGHGRAPARSCPPRIGTPRRPRRAFIGLLMGLGLGLGVGVCLEARRVICVYVFGVYCVACVFGVAVAMHVYIHIYICTYTHTHICAYLCMAVAEDMP